MDTKRKITIWDTDPNRIAEISINLTLAMNETGFQYELASMSEPPLLSRMGLYGKTPTLEIDGNYWTLRVGETIPKDDAKVLLEVLEKIS